MTDLIRAGLLALVLSVNLAAPVAAGPLEDGVNAYEHHNYWAALELLRPLAVARRSGWEGSDNQDGNSASRHFGMIVAACLSRKGRSRP